MESHRARLKKLLQKHNRMIKLEPRIIREDQGGKQTEQYDTDVIGRYFIKESVSSLFEPPIQDSEWFTLNPQEKYVF